MPSHHTAIGANSLEHKERYDVITDEEWYCTFWLRYGTPSDSGGKYVRFVLRIETGADRTTIIVDIFDIVQQVRDDTTSIHLKVNEEPKSSRGLQKRNERQERRRTHVYLP